jgi:hypothetical protein
MTPFRRSFSREFRRAFTPSLVFDSVLGGVTFGFYHMDKADPVFMLKEYGKLMLLAFVPGMTMPRAMCLYVVYNRKP